jgi:hypothetical protein
MEFSVEFLAIYEINAKCVDILGPGNYFKGTVASD